MDDLIRRSDALAAFAESTSAMPEKQGRRRIEGIPAVDAVEMRHAWPVKFYSDPYTGRLFTTCSACDGKIGPRDKYCKHCGARMDGRREDGDA